MRNFGTRPAQYEASAASFGAQNVWRIPVGVGITVIESITNYRLLDPWTAITRASPPPKGIGNFAIDYDYRLL